MALFNSKGFESTELNTYTLRQRGQQHFPLLTCIQAQELFGDILDEENSPVSRLFTSILGIHIITLTPGLRSQNRLPGEGES